MPTYWLIKSEPEVWSFDQQHQVSIEPWDGVRNYQARNNIKAMNIGDLCFFYHSSKEKRIVGIIEVASEYREDETDLTGKFGLRDMKYVRHLKRPVTLSEIKANPRLSSMILIKQSRLSVLPISESEWDNILQLSEETPIK